MVIEINLIPIGALLLTTVVFGVWVGRLGKPYNTLLFNIHKLAALGGVVLTGIGIFGLDPFREFPAKILIFLGLAVLGVIVLFSTGAMMSINGEQSKLALFLHRIALTIIIILFVLMIFL